MLDQAICRQVIFFVFATFFFSACEDEAVPDNPDNSSNFENGVFIISEGQFNNGNASLSFFDLEKQELQENIFQSVNNRALGDVFQSMSISGDVAYLVLNNSAKVEVVNSRNMESIAQIEGLSSPRHFVKIDNEKAYVSDLYADGISVVNLDDYSIQGTIPMRSWTEQMLEVGTEVWVAMPWLFQDEPSPYIYAIDSYFDSVVDSVEIGIDQVAMLIDNDFLYVYCKGNPNTDIKGGIIRMNTQTREVNTIASFEDFDFNFAPRMVMHPNGKIYFTKKGIFSLDIETGTLTKVIEEDGRDFYGLGIDPANGHLWVSDAIDFQQKSNIFEYTAEGVLVQSFKGGIGTNSFYFN
jgi:DNA-binding beta-propeller fold protein YncE